MKRTKKNYIFGTTTGVLAAIVVTTILINKFKIIWKLILF